MHHYDGSAWGVVIPSTPISSPDRARYSSDGLYVWTTAGVGRLAPDGAVTDLTGSLAFPDAMFALDLLDGVLYVARTLPGDGINLQRASIYRREGNDWIELPAQLPQAIYALRVMSSTAIWASSDTGIEFFDGNAWQVIAGYASIHPAGSATAVWGDGIWMIGRQASASPGNSGTATVDGWLLAHQHVGGADETITTDPPGEYRDDNTMSFYGQGIVGLDDNRVALWGAREYGASLSEEVVELEWYESTGTALSERRLMVHLENDDCPEEFEPGKDICSSPPRFLLLDASPAQMVFCGKWFDGENKEALFVGNLE